MIIILLIIILILIYLLIIQYRKNVKYENLIGKYDTTISEIIEYMNSALDRLYYIDSRHIFESDDEVGWFFKSLKDTIVKLNNFLTTIVDENYEQ